MNSQRTLPSTVWPVPIQLIWLIVEELQSQGIGADKLLHGSSLTAATLGDAERVLPYDETVALIARAQTLSRVPDLGIRVGRRQTPSGWGILGYAINCCATAGDALQMGVKYHRVSPSLNRLTLQHTGDLAYWTLHPPINLGEALPFAVEQEFVAFCRAGPLLTGRPVPLKEAHFSYPAPAYLDAYKQAFKCKLMFNAPLNQLVLDAECLDYPILQANPLSVATATRLCEQFLAAHPATNPLTMQIRKRLLEQPDRYPSAEELAAELHITSRTLRNRLRQSGQSYQQILDGVREQLARGYLQEAPLKVDDIAARLKFSDARSFRRAFKKWTGQTPDAFRANG